MQLDLLARTFPPAIAALVAPSRREDVSIPPIFDSMVSHYHSGRVVLVGDAGSMTRPHMSSGATKALEEGLALTKWRGGNSVFTEIGDSRMNRTGLRT